MIVSNLHQQMMGCTVCKEVHPIPRSVLRDPEQLLNLREDVEHDHRECAANPDNLKLAIANRTFRKRIERELAKATQRKAA